LTPRLGCRSLRGDGATTERSPREIAFIGETSMDNPNDKPESNAPEEPAGEEQPSVAGLSDLAHEELDEQPEPEPEPPPVPEGMPTLAAAPQPEKPKEPEWEPPPMTVTFWQKLAPKEKTVRPIHIILVLLVLVLAGGGAAAYFLVLRQPSAVKDGTAIAKADTDTPDAKAKAATPKDKAAPAEKKAAPAKPAADKDKGTTAKTPKSRKRTRKTRKTKSEPAAAPAEPAPAEPAPAEPAPAAESGGEPLNVRDIKLGVKKNMSKVKTCIKSARQSGVLAPGKHTLILDWIIAPSGKVTEGRVRGPSRLLGTSFDTCFSRAMRRWEFRPSPKGAPVKNFPLPFSLK
jgi:hypothetical protein